MKITVNGYDLDEEQLACILENPKYSLIIAGAGSGKTLTLIGKIKYILENDLLKPEEICCLSFTNETVTNLQANILKNCHCEVSVFTFHKLALKILEVAHQTYKIAPPTLLEETIKEFFETMCFGNQDLQQIVFQKFSFSLFKNEKTWQKILISKDFLSFKKTIQIFISLMKSNHYTYEDLKDFFKVKKYQQTLILIYAIYTLYETEKESDFSIDFDDMMNKAKEALKQKRIPLPYKLIIIDEFQDTSQSRFHLIQEIVKQNDASLCVVGDDYQSIYHFSGCDLELFLHFQDYYPTAKIYKLQKTYRNSRELIETAGTFIMKNPNQVKKNLVSPKQLEKPILLTFYKKKDTVLEKIISRIPKNKEILIIGRNNFDLKQYTKNLKYQVLENHYIEFKKFKNRKIRYLTIHKAKGLESDIVIFLNLENSLYGIPSKLKEEKILSLVKKKQYFPFEEERRLFYVGLTRTKSYIYLLVPENNPSIFIKEIKHEKNVQSLHV